MNNRTEENAARQREIAQIKADPIFANESWVETRAAHHAVWEAVSPLSSAELLRLAAAHGERAKHRIDIGADVNAAYSARTAVRLAEIADSERAFEEKNWPNGQRPAFFVAPIAPLPLEQRLAAIDEARATIDSNRALLGPDGEELDGDLYFAVEALKKLRQAVAAQGGAS